MIARAVLLVGVLLGHSVCLAQSDEQWRFENVERVVAVSDIHGAYDAMVATFREATLIDERLNWVGGKSHLVIAGDILDRGPQSRQIVDLMMVLEQQAIEAGGRIHVLLGNHEVMNMTGDNRYVSDDEFAAFAAEESAQEREYWFRKFSQQHLTHTDEKTVRKRFNEEAPEGFFGHRRAFRIDGRYGKWLVEKPMMIVINDTAYVHGGLPPYVTEHGLAGVNTLLKNDLVDFLHARSKLEAAEVVSPVDGFRELPALLESKLGLSSLDREAAAAAEVIISLRESPLHRSSGPLWYRGNAKCSALTEGEALDVVLDVLNASRVVIGHTTTKSRQIQTRFGGRVVEVNTGMLHSSYEGSGYALIIESEELSIASENGEQGFLPVEPPRLVGNRPGKLDDDALSTALVNGEVVGDVSDQSGRQLIGVLVGEDVVPVHFVATSPGRSVLPEVAAYRLDRMLGLDMVPVTVSRAISGRSGLLQLAAPDALNEVDRNAKDQRSGPCSIEQQHASMMVFDALIGNDARSPYSMLYEDDDWQLMLVGHSRSFNDIGINQLGTIVVNNEWRRSLSRITRVELEERLGDVLDDERITDLVNRVNALTGH